MVSGDRAARSSGRSAAQPPPPAWEIAKRDRVTAGLPGRPTFDCLQARLADCWHARPPDWQSDRHTAGLPDSPTTSVFAECCLSARSLEALDSRTAHTAERSANMSRHHWNLRRLRKLCGATRYPPTHAKWTRLRVTARVKLSSFPSRAKKTSSPQALATTTHIPPCPHISMLQRTRCTQDDASGRFFRTGGWTPLCVYTSTLK